MTRAIHRLRQRTRGERGDGRESGVALVELLVMTMLLVLIVFGIIEFGNGWKNKLQVEVAARAGARVGSSLGTDRLADYGLLTSVRTALAELGFDNVDYVVVYEASNTDGSPLSASCTSSTPTSQTGKCNVYTGTQVKNLSQASFTGTTSCTGSSPDRFWCPTTREDLQSASAGASFVGVWIRARSNTFTSFFGSPLKMEVRAVMQVEPKEDT